MNYSDVWSCGIILFSMLFGFPPFHEDSMNDGDCIEVGNQEEIIFNKIKEGFNPVTKEGYGNWFPEVYVDIYLCF